MALSTTDLQALLDETEAAYYRGVRSVSFRGEAVTYASSAEMWTAIQRIRSQLAASTARPRYLRLRTGGDS